MKKQLFVALAAILCSFQLTAQTPEEKTEAFNIGKRAVKIMDEGKLDESIELLEKAQKLDPSNYLYPYEIAFALYQKKEYSKAIKILEHTVDNYSVVKDDCYQLLGSMYDYAKKPGKAIEKYKDGLKKFPNSGRLYLELGVVEAMSKDNIGAAIGYWETGIQVDPSYSSNYYWAAKVYCNSKDKVWGVIYAELFLNLERRSKRTIEISKLLYDTYKSAVTFSSKDNYTVKFSSGEIMLKPLEKGKKFKLPFGTHYELAMSLGIANVLSSVKNNELTASSICAIKQSFIEQWFKQETHKDYPNVLFDFQAQLKEKGFSEAYNHWLLMMGSEVEFDEWNAKNEEAFKAFVEWFTPNPLVLNAENRCYRSQYD